MLLCISRFSQHPIVRFPNKLFRLDRAAAAAADCRILSQVCRRFRFFPAAAMMIDSGDFVDFDGEIGNGGGGDSFNGRGDDSGGWNSEDGTLSYGYSSFQGKRSHMEDYYDAKTFKIDGETVGLFGVFDGHAGYRAAEYLKKNLFINLMKHPQFATDTKTAISETFIRTDADFLDAESNIKDGSTAIAAVLIGRHLYVANVGDSRAVMSKAAKAIPLSVDHKPNRSDERQRIERAGGYITWSGNGNGNGTWRVEGVLAMSRAFGDRLLKKYVLAEPEIQEQFVDYDLEFLILASDGLWDAVPNMDAVSIASKEEQPEAAACKLVETAFTRGSSDNITCMVVKFPLDRMDIDYP